MGIIEEELKSVRSRLSGAGGMNAQTWSLEEAAKALRVSRKRLRALLLSGAIRSVVVKGRRTIPRDVVVR